MKQFSTADTETAIISGEGDTCLFCLLMNLLLILNRSNPRKYLHYTLFSGASMYLKKYFKIRHIDPLTANIWFRFTPPNLPFFTKASRKLELSSSSCEKSLLQKLSKTELSQREQMCIPGIKDRSGTPHRESYHSFCVYPKGERSEWMCS